jgi:hypothetical protein
MEQKFRYAFLVSLLTIFLTSNYATAAPSHRSPDIAFDSENDRYLSVYSWCADGGLCDLDINLYGKLIDNDGSPLGLQFIISNASRVQTNASVAYDSLTQRYLVVWQDDRGALDTDIYGQLVNADGFLFSDEILISQATDGNQDNPSVSYDDVNDRFLVVWQDGRNFSASNSDIWGQIVLADGSLDGPNIAISEATGAETSPVVAFDSYNQIFLTVWEDIGTDGPTSKGIYGQVVHTNGTLEGVSFVIAATTVDSSLKNPSIAYDTVNRNFLVVWDSRIQYSFGRLETIYGRLVKVSSEAPPLGFVPIGVGTTFSIYGADTVTNIRSAPIDIDAQNPAVASSSGGNFLVAWEDGRNVSTADFETDIYARWINGDGSTDGDDFDVFTGLLEQDNSAIAYNSQQNNFAIAFETGPVESQDIQIVLVSADGTDLTPPVITLIGANPLELEIGTGYVEPGATATDDVDGDISTDIVIDSSAVNTNATGSYSVTYNVSDAAGNPAAEVVRTVNVVDTTDPTFELSVPGDGATDAAVDTNIEVHVRDSGTGVEQTSIQMTVEGEDVTASLSFSGTAADYTATYNPPVDFANGQEVNVTVSATDVAGNSGSDVFSFLTVAGSVWDPAGDEDNDGIPNGVEETLLHTDPTVKTLFVRPKRRTGFSSYEYWEGFIALFPRAGLSGFADIPPFTNAGIEISVIGDPNNPYGPMQAFDYDPQTDANHPPCDILEVVYMRDDDYCLFSPDDNEGHTFFTGTTWSWDTKGYTPHNSGTAHYIKYGYFTAQVYPYPLANYFSEGAFNSIAVGQTPVLLDSSSCTYDQCWDYANTGRSPMNLNALDAVNGLPDDTVEFNEMTFSASGEIQSMGALGLGYDSDAVLKRTIVHEMGHALLYALDDEDHCDDFECSMYHSARDWELHNFGSPSGCIHSAGGSRDIRATGIVHNSVHLP